MLSGPVRSTTTANGKADDAASAGSVDWLPDFGPPALSLDLSPLPTSGPALEPAATPALTPQKATAAATPAPAPAPALAGASAGLADAGLYAHFGDYTGMVSDMSGYLLDRADESATALAADTPSDDDDADCDYDASSTAVPFIASAQRQPPTIAALGETLSGDHDVPATPRLSFHFHTDPAIDAISSVPLFPLASPVAAAADPVSPAMAAGAAQPAEEAAGSPLSATAQPQMQPLADATAKPGSPEKVAAAAAVGTAGRKSRGRRASFAGLLMRRASKFVEVSSPPGSREAVDQPASQDEAAALAAVTPAPSSAVSGELAATSASGTSSAILHESADYVEQPSARVPSTVAEDDADAEPSCASLAPETQDEAESCAASEADCDSSDSSVAEEDAEDDAPGTDGPALDGPSSDGPVSDGPERAAASGIASELGASSTSTSRDSASAAAGLPPVPTTRSLEKRSSRIISGITRKVNYVRQTTSMVLRRSVGSRLSMAVDRSADASAQHSQSAAGPETDEDDALKDRQKPSLEDSAGEHESVDASDTAPAAAPEDPSDVVDEAAAGTCSAELDTTASAHEAGATDSDEPSTSAAGSADKDGLDATTTSFSRRLGLVRRGTNEVVRSGVSRVKSMFATKRPVPA
ncbi:hypothetical protein H4R19_005038 [Coemansia spiralis]|nr:hypothetical protein H4R19_005038 [Coemansia spiralis]